MFHSFRRGWLAGMLIFTLGVVSGWSNDTPYYPIISLRFGQIHGHLSSDFFDVYNNFASFPRPSLTTDTQWDDFYPQDAEFSWAAEFGLTLKRHFILGISIQAFNHQWKDELTYTSTLKFPDGNLVTISDIKELHQFEIHSYPVLAFLDFRFFSGSWIRPVVGIGAGINTLSLQWSWKLNGKKVTEDGTYVIEDSDVYLNKKREIVLALQPRLKIELSMSRVNGLGKFVDCLYVQADYLYARYDFDFFRRYRDKVLSKIPTEDLTEAQKKLFQTFELDAGGWQLMAGITFRFEVPGERE